MIVSGDSPEDRSSIRTDLEDVKERLGGDCIMAPDQSPKLTWKVRESVKCLGGIG